MGPTDPRLEKWLVASAVATIRDQLLAAATQHTACSSCRQSLGRTTPVHVMVGAAVSIGQAGWKYQPSSLCPDKRPHQLCRFLWYVGRAVMSYLQVVGEQHHQVETHMEAFTNRLTDLQAKHNLLLPGAVEVGPGATATACAASASQPTADHCWHQ